MAAAKKLFLIDAMAHVYRAFFAPMVRMNAPSGMPTKVPFLFNNILRRLVKDYQPDYIGVVFDTSKPTFRDKLFEQYKAHRTPMPDELKQQLPYVKRLCEALRLPVIQFDGFEADDVLGALSVQAAKQKLDVLLVTNDKDMMQLVGSGVRVLRPGTGGMKNDVIVDAAKVKEILEERDAGTEWSIMHGVCLATASTTFPARERRESAKKAQAELIIEIRHRRERARSRQTKFSETSGVS